MSGPTLFKLGDTQITLAGSSFGIDNMTTIGVSIITNAASSGNLTFNSGTSIYFDIADTNRMMIDADGNVGIRTNEPEEIFHVATSTVGEVARVGAAAIGNRSTTAAYAFFGHYGTNDATKYAISQSSVGDTFINASSPAQLAFMIDNVVAGRFHGANKYFAIGTHVPSYPLDVRGTGILSPASGGYYFNTGGGVVALSGGIGGVKIRTDGSILCADAVIAASDSRIKKDITEIPDGEALSKIRLLNPYKYKYIDVIEKGEENVYGFLAQEVKNILPYAVKIITTEVIPNVYQGGTFNNGVITLTQPHGLTENGNVRLLITNKARQIHCPYTVFDTLKISIDTTNLSVNDIPTNDPLYDENGDQLDYNIFVYGVEVDDFHTLKKDTIWTTGIAALQEVDRIQQSNNIKIEDLVTQLDAEKIKVSDLLARVTALENP